MKIIICGGHLTPALSVIEALSKEDDIYYFGRKFAIEGDRAMSLEYQSVIKLGIPFVEINTGRYQRKFTKHTIPSLLKIPGGFLSALSQLSKLKPDVVVGFGGYVSVPACFAAKFLNIPVVIHEQTLEAGTANKILSKIAKKICISFDSSKKYFPENKIVMTGNPIRKTIFNPTHKFSSMLSKPAIYITGGSLGSHAINLLVMESLSNLLEKFTVIHQTGSSEEFRDFEKLSTIKDKLNKKISEKYVLSKFFSPEEIGEIFNVTDLVIGRSGINTISELIVFNKPSILIPLPISQKNEQLKNALFIKSLGLGEVVEQKNLSPQRFIELVSKVIGNLDNYKLIDKQKYFSENSAKRITDVIYAAAKDNH